MIEIVKTFFTMNMESMTANDWFGVITTVLSFILICFAYFWVFHPTNKHTLEGYRHHLLTHDKDEPMD
jgi:cytochrome c oxidase cbb3-type subunit 4